MTHITCISRVSQSDLPSMDLYLTRHPRYCSILRFVFLFICKMTSFSFVYSRRSVSTHKQKRTKSFSKKNRKKRIVLLIQKLFFFFTILCVSFMGIFFVSNTYSMIQGILKYSKRKRTEEKSTCQ
jgi:hypothetical protein